MGKEIPNRIAEARAMSGLSRTQCAARIGVSERIFWRWERGDTQIPDKHKPALADLFGITVVWLMRWESNDNGNDKTEAAA